MKNFYLLLAALGLIWPYSQFVPWLLENGLNMPLLWHEIVSSRISAFAWADVVVSVIAIILFAVWESRRLAMPFPILPIVGCLIVGASFGLPLFLYMRQKQLTETA